MALLIAQLSDTHVGGPAEGSGARLSLAVDEVNAMTRQPDLVLITGDLTHAGAAGEWAEFQARVSELRAPWTCIRGNHDRQIMDFTGHRAMDLGPLRLVLVDSSAEEFTDEDARWLDVELTAHADRITMVAIHHPPFETGIWWMDCVGLSGRERFEDVVRRHPHVRLVVSGHVHRPIVTAWGSCVLWSSPSTAVAIAADLDPDHDPAETAEPPMISLHAHVGDGFVSHLVPVGASASRTSISKTAPEFVEWARGVQSTRPSRFEN